MDLKPIWNKLLIFDGSHFLHRALCQPNLWDMRRQDIDEFKRIRTGGVYGSLNTIIKECKSFDYFPVVVFDGKLSKRRLNVYPNYKHHEEKMLLESNQYVDEQVELQRQFRTEYNTERNIIEELLTYLGIPTFRFDTWEGDDIIYILTKLSKDSIVVSDDKDMWQLVCDDENRRCRVRRGMTNEFITMDYFRENNMTTKDYIACKAIVGDVSDNIPTACNGTGEKTALGLWKLYKANRTTMIDEFPTNEEQLAEQCMLVDVPKRKAYLNFNEQQFIDNMCLMDLDFVDYDIDDELIENIKTEFNRIANKTDLDKTKELMDYLQFKTIDYMYLIYRIQETYSQIQLKY